MFEIDLLALKTIKIPDHKPWTKKYCNAHIYLKDIFEIDLLALKAIKTLDQRSNDICKLNENTLTYEIKTRHSCGPQSNLAFSVPLWELKCLVKCVNKN